ncbi:hypothetical protein D3Z50_09865 [Clostridiaceae bacterium]|nr:hypothetical protein [Clostridiaceae bacterium]
MGKRKRDSLETAFADAAQSLKAAAGRCSLPEPLKKAFIRLSHIVLLYIPYIIKIKKTRRFQYVLFI